MADPSAVLADIGAFNRGQMHHVQVEEKQVLPDKEQVESERKEAQLRQEIERAGGELKLNHVQVEEKAALPDAEAIAREKQEQQLLQQIQGGTELKHVEVQEKACLPDAGAIAEEKAAAAAAVVANGNGTE